MRTGVVVGMIGIVAAGGALTTAALVRPRAEVPTRHPQHRLADERARSPGIHRAKPAELAAIDRVARAESAKIIARKKALLPSVPATTWVNLGPTDSPEEVNFFSIAGVDSGRPNNIVVDPRDGNVVYMAVSGGGV